MASKELDLGSVIGPQGPQGNVGPQGAQGIQGVPGKDATLNGYNTASIRGGDNVSVEDDGAGTLTLNVDQSAKQDTLTFDDAPTEGSGNPVKSGGVWDALQRKPNRNLLDNWYFVGGGSQQGGGQFPINQRGEVEYTDVGYTIDRWTNLFPGSIISLDKDGVTAANYLVQYLNHKELVPGTYTFSVLATGGVYSFNVWAEGEITPGYSTNETLASTTFKLTSEFLTPSLRVAAFPNPGSKIVAAKLELGPVQTLAHQENGVWVLNEVPDYGEELRKCQRYYQEASGYFAGWSSSVTNFYASVPLVTPMAKSPAVSGNFSNSGGVLQNGRYHLITAVASAAAITSDEAIVIQCTASDMTLETEGVIANLQIALDANL